MKKLFAVSGIIFFSEFLSAQMTVTTGYTATQLANELAGSNVTISSSSITGNTLQYGLFEFAGSGFPLSSGIVLSSGFATDVIGPNDGGASGSMGGPGSTILDDVIGGTTNDAVEFTFSFEVQSSSVEFNYIFASEEYNEYVGSGFNDVFGFFISGPGITGWENIALIPDTNVPVAINNVNNGSFWQYYNDNETGTTNIELDGYTDVLTAKKEGLIPCEVYTLKLIIADVTDDALDSGVFLEANSLEQGTVSASANTFSANDIALEGCIDASFTFSLDTVQTTPAYIPISIGGSAVNGVDYAFVDTLVVIPPGQLSATLIIDALSDGLAEGQESIELYFVPAPCAPMDTVTLYIDDYTTLEFETVVTDVSCPGASDGQIAFTITGGTAPFTAMVTDSATNVTTTYTTLPVTGLDEGTYYIEVLDNYGCPAQDIVAGNLYTGGAVFLPDGNGSSYQTSLPIAGMPATLTSVSQIQSICMTMEHSRIGELEIVLEAPDGTQIVMKQQPGGNVTNMGEPCATGPTDGGGGGGTAAGIGYTYCFTPSPTYGTMVDEAGVYTYTYTNPCDGSSQSDKYLPAGSYESHEPLSDLIGVPINGNWTLIITDEIPNNNGWVFDWSISFQADPPDSVAYVTEPEMPSATFTSVNPSCGNNNGSINATVTGTNTPFSFDWSSGQTTEDISGLSAGTYTLTVSDALGCDNDYTFALSNSTATSITLSTTPQQCVVGNTGAINLTPGAGPAPLSYSWSNGATTQDISGLAPGVYSVNMTDGAGCISSATTTVAAASNIIITGTTTNENCGDQEGTIDINVLGGNSSSYTYVWSNGAVTQDVTDLAAGTYTVTVTDANNCTQTASFTILNLVGSCIPVCDLSVTNSILTDETCGNANGVIGINISTTNAPYSVSWSNGASTSTISGLTAGSYTVTVNDNEGCVFTETYSISNMAGTLAITSVNSANETCGNGIGAVDITVSGGVMPYTYLWSNGATTQDINSLSAGTYTVTVTDNNACSISQTFNVLNETGTLTQTYGNAEDEICGNGAGSIDIAVVGGFGTLSYAWNNGALTQDLPAVSAGSYFCVVTDGAGCQLTTPTYVVNNQSGGMSITNIDVDDEICGNNQGEILLTVAGGTLPYSYSWSNGATSSSLTNLSSGTYSCVITDASGCSVSTGSLTVLDLPGSLNVVSVSSINEICGSGTGMVNLNVSGGTAPIVYAWSNGSSSQNLSGLSAGAYTCTINDAAGCTTTANAFISNESGTLAIDNMVVTNENCGNGAGAINAFISGQTGMVTYSWSSGQVTQDISGLSAGSYTLTVSDASGCSVSSSASVSNITGGLSLSTIAVTNEQCGQSDGAIDMAISGGTAPYTYSWSNGATTEDLSSIDAGTYTVTVTDAAACEISASYTITNSSGGLSASGGVSNEVCSNDVGAINLTVTGGTSPYTFAWSNAATTEDISGLSAGTYSVTVTDNTGCSTNQSFTVINASGTLSIAGAIITDESCGDVNGAVNISVAGGSGTYTYLWSNSATTQDITSLNDGIYSVTVNDGAGCVTTGSYTVNASSGSFTLVSVAVTDEVCGNNAGAITTSFTGGLAPTTYSWNTGATSANLTGLSSGVYSCTATDANGCTISFSDVVNDDPGTLDVTSVSVTNPTCGNSNGSVDIAVSGGSGAYTYVWNNGSTTQDLSAISAGVYTLTLSDGAGCMLNESVTVTGGGQPVITGFTTSDETCGQGNGTATVNVTGGAGPYTYSWVVPSCCDYELQLDGFGTWDTEKVEVKINGTVYGNYIGTGFGPINYEIPACNGDVLEFTYTDGGGFDWMSFSVFDPQGNSIFASGWPAANGASYSTTANCNGGSTGQTLSGLNAGSYTVTVTNANGCTVSGTATVGSTTGILQVTDVDITDIFCGANGAVDITVVGDLAPTTYSWSTGATTQDITGITVGGNYTVTITNGSGCSITEIYTVANITNGFAITDTVIVADTCDNAFGSIDITLNGIDAPYTYSWSHGPTTEDVTSLVAGTYIVTVTDNSGCDLSESYVVVNELTSTEVTSVVILDEYCGNATGSIDITVGNGPAPYSFVWSNGALTEDISSLEAGSFDVVITDNLGCSIVETYSVGNTTNGLAVTSVVTDETCTGNNGAIDITIAGGVSPYTINWSSGETTEDLTGLVADDYTVVVVDQDNCELTTVITVDLVVPDITIDNAFVWDDFCDAGNGGIDLTVSSSSPLSYLWSNGDTFEDAFSLFEGDYTVTITDDNGCSIIGGPYTVGNSAWFSITGIVTDASCATCTDGSIDMTVVGGFGGEIITWSNGATTEDISGLLPGTYTVTVDDGFGCVVDTTFTVGYGSGIVVNQPNSPQFSLYPNPTRDITKLNYVLTQKSDLVISVHSVLGEVVRETEIYSASSGAIEFDLHDLQRGTYMITITDGTGRYTLPLVLME